jgi:hypothetical protein
MMASEPLCRADSPPADVKKVATTDEELRHAEWACSYISGEEIFASLDVPSQSVRVAVFWKPDGVIHGRTPWTRTEDGGRHVTVAAVPASENRFSAFLDLLRREDRVIAGALEKW